MKLRPRTLTGRLIATLVALVALVSVLVAVSASLVVGSYLTQQLDQRLSESLARATGTNEAGADPDHEGGFGPGNYGGIRQALARCQLVVPRGQEPGSSTVVTGPDCAVGYTVSSDGSLTVMTADDIKDLSTVPSGKEARTVAIDDSRMRVQAATVKTADGTVKVIQAIPMAETDRVITLLIWGEIALSATGIALAAAMGTIIVRRQMSPLRQVASTANAVTHTDLSSGKVSTMARVPENLADPSSEVGQVGEALNQMISHVEHALDERHRSELQLRAFLADASHELRTPLSTIKGYAELTRRTGTDASETMRKVESEANRMSALVEDMLLLARLDAGRPLESMPVGLAQLVIEAMNDARVVDPERRWQIQVPEEQVVVIGDELRLHQAVTNLINNASRHTPEGTTVTATVLTDPIRVQIHDDGPGISPELQASIFDRFTRGDSSRTRTSGGAGLGMSLVQAIMTAHGGTATVRSSPGDTTFELTFPMGTDLG